VYSIYKRLSQNFSFGKTTLKFAVLQGFKPEKPQRAYRTAVSPGAALPGSKPE
jgi:hypothetical protein